MFIFDVLATQQGVHCIWPVACRFRQIVCEQKKQLSWNWWCFHIFVLSLGIFIIKEKIIPPSQGLKLVDVREESVNEDENEISICVSIQHTSKKLQDELSWAEPNPEGV